MTDTYRCPVCGAALTAPSGAEAPVHCEVPALLIDGKFVLPSTGESILLAYTCEQLSGFNQEYHGIPAERRPNECLLPASGPVIDVPRHGHILLSSRGAANAGTKAATLRVMRMRKLPQRWIHCCECGNKRRG